MIICKLCEKKIKSIKSLSIHLRKHKNITIEEYYNKFLKKGNNDSCLVCRNKTKFISLSHGYNIYCSRNCSGNDAKNRIKKTQETMILKYGVSNCSSLDWVKQKKKDTCNKNHNADFPFQSNKIKEKIKQTMIIKYDNEHPMKVPSIKDKAIKNMTQTKNTKEFKEKHIKLIHKKFYLRLISSDRLNFACTPLFNIDEYKGITHNYNWKCNKCNNVFFDNLDDGKIPRCNICYPKKTPIIEKEVSSFIKSIGDINIIENDRIALNGKEIDIYIPDKNIGIEFNGLYWHSEVSGKTDKSYHEEKHLIALNNNIRLIQIFEDEWLNKQDIIKSILMNILGNSKRIFARKCKLININQDDAKDFLFNNHLQGPINGTNIGLYYNNELVSMITIGKSRYNKNYEYEILRFCSKQNTSVVGGFSKLLKHAIKSFGKSIITYADARFGTGNVYKNSGFLQIDKSKPNYFYLNKNHTTRQSRIKYQKHKLPNLLESFDPNLTEWENMQLNGFDRIWDCGNYVYVLQ